MAFLLFSLPALGVVAVILLGIIAERLKEAARQTEVLLAVHHELSEIRSSNSEIADRLIKVQLAVDRLEHDRR